jgi:hypothetical protein
MINSHKTKTFILSAEEVENTIKKFSINVAVLKINTIINIIEKLEKENIKEGTPLTILIGLDMNLFHIVNKNAFVNTCHYAHIHLENKIVNVTETVQELFYEILMHHSNIGRPSFDVELKYNKEALINYFANYFFSSVGQITANDIYQKIEELNALKEKQQLDNTIDNTKPKSLTKIKL